MDVSTAHKRKSEGELEFCQPQRDSSESDTNEFERLRYGPVYFLEHRRFGREI